MSQLQDVPSTEEIKIGTDTFPTQGLVLVARRQLINPRKTILEDHSGDPFSGAPAKITYRPFGTRDAALVALIQEGYSPSERMLDKLEQALKAYFPKWNDYVERRQQLADQSNALVGEMIKEKQG